MMEDIKRKRTVVVIDDSSDDDVAARRTGHKRPMRDSGIFSWVEKKPKLENRDSFLGEDDDIEVLMHRPGEQPVAADNYDDDGADVMVTGVRGDGSALKDLPHSRHLCVVEPFASTTTPLNARFCKQCFCYVCDQPVTQCPSWGSGLNAYEHCQAHETDYWRRKRAGAKSGAARAQARPGPLGSDHFFGNRPNSANAAATPHPPPTRPASAANRTADPPTHKDDPHLDEDYLPLGTISVPVVSISNYDLVNLPPTHSPYSMGIFLKEIGGKYLRDYKSIYIRIHTGEDDLPAAERIRELELDAIVAEVRTCTRPVSKEKSALRVALTVEPDQISPKEGVIRVKVFQLRRFFNENVRTLNTKIIQYFCKDDMQFQREIDELRRLDLDRHVLKIKSFDRLLKVVQSCKYDEEEQPDGLTVTLRPYQKQSLHFMLESERREDGFQGLFWRKMPGAGTDQEDVYYCPPLQRIKLVQKDAALPVTTGGFLCEEMGLGKTVEILALVLANKHPNPPLPPPAPVPRNRIKVDQIPEGGVPSKATLVVCAVSLVGQWISEAKSKLSAPVSMYKYHGSGRTHDPFFLAGQDIVVTTYATLGSDYSQCMKTRVLGGPKLSNVQEFAKTSPLHAINWWRIVLDESHTIKDPKATHSRACNELKADRRWCCTGTPINTRISDLYGQFKFLKMSPFDETSTFNKEIAQPFESSSHGRVEFGASKTVLVDLLQKVMIRHVKSQKINGEELLVLPPKTQVDMPVQFTPEERVVYERAKAQAKESFSYFSKMGPLYIGKHTLQIMSLLLPLRRICSGGQIFNVNDTPAEEQTDQAGPSTSPSDSECGICFEVMEQPARTPCNHWFCNECLTSAINSEPRDLCPLCRQTVSADEIFLGERGGSSTAIVPYAGPDNGAQGGDGAGLAGDQGAPFVAESKLQALLADLEKTREEDPTAKSLIFSQFMGTIDWLKTKLTEAGVTYRYISGDMPLNKRAKAIEQFQQDPPTTVFLLSIRTGAVGITLTSASIVYLLEPVLNPALEDQAVGRAWRMGQQRPVTVKRMFIEGSVEEKILQVVKSRVEGSAEKATDPAERIAYRGKKKGTRPETIAGSIRSDKQNLRMSEYEVLFS